jgi:glutathione S-transferase
MLHAVNVKLYTLPGSHPCAAVEVALKSKGIDYHRVDLLPMSQLLVGPMRYGGYTVPGMRIGSEKLLGSRTIMRRLDELVSEPSLLPSEEDARQRVLEAERWGDEDFQDTPRKIIDVAFLRDPSAMLSYVGDAKLPLPRSMMRPALPLTARLMAVRNKAREETVRTALASLPGKLEKIDGWISDGVLGGERPNAADLQIGSTVRLLLSIGDVAPLLRDRPAATLERYFPPMVGEVPVGTLPAQWLPVSAAA